MPTTLTATSLVTNFSSGSPGFFSTLLGKRRTTLISDASAFTCRLNKLRAQLLEIGITDACCSLLQKEQPLLRALPHVVAEHGSFVVFRCPTAADDNDSAPGGSP